MSVRKSDHAERDRTLFIIVGSGRYRIKDQNVNGRMQWQDGFWPTPFWKMINPSCKKAVMRIADWWLSKKKIHDVVRLANYVPPSGIMEW